jgi:protein-disulfide isomerase
MSVVSLDTPLLTVPVSERDHVLGPATAPLTLLEYGDYECPFCGAAHVVLKQLLQIMGDEVRLAFRNFPLAQIHPHAQLAAEAAEAAGLQGRFWEMHDLLFEHQDRLQMRDVIGYAAALRLDLERFGIDLSQHTCAPRVREDFLSGIRSGVNGTPTFFINGVRHNGGYDLESLIAALRSAL